jgi:DNA-binding PucR family transcriptional regulator
MSTQVTGVLEPDMDSDADVTQYVADTAARLQDRLAQVSSGIQVTLENEIPELGGDRRDMEVLGPSVLGNVETLLRAVRYAIPVNLVAVPVVAMEYARRLAQYGILLNALVRAYRLGQHLTNEMVFAEVRAIDIPYPAKYTVLEAISATLFQYIDSITQQVVVYEDERERWLENQNSLRAMRVREVLAAHKPVDVDAATTAIHYPLRWHDLALVMWYPDAGTAGDEIGRLQPFLKELGHASEAVASPLFIAADRTCGWGWLPYRMATESAAARVREFAVGRAGAPSVAIGTVAAGLEGFRQSHREAEGARRVALVGARPERIMIGAEDRGVPLAALLGGEIADTRAWVAGVLGELAADTDNDARLRETLRVFLRCGSSYKQAADELNLHFNTVKYRVRRAIARRGKEVAADRLDVEVALLVCDWYGASAAPRWPRGRQS